MALILLLRKVSGVNKQCYAVDQLEQQYSSYEYKHWRRYASLLARTYMVQLFSVISFSTQHTTWAAISFSVTINQLQQLNIKAAFQWPIACRTIGPIASSCLYCSSAASVNEHYKFSDCQLAMLLMCPSSLMPLFRSWLDASLHAKHDDHPPYAQTPTGAATPPGTVRLGKQPKHGAHVLRPAESESADPAWQPPLHYPSSPSAA